MKNKKILIILSAVLMLSTAVAVFQNKYKISAKNLAKSKLLKYNSSILDQEIIKELEEPRATQVLYANNQIVGYVNDIEEIEEKINDINKKDYSKEFENSKLGFGEDVFISEEMTYFIYEDIDKEIKNYIVENDLLAIESNKITFSNGAIIYVKNLEDFENAKEKYLLNFVSEEELSYIKDGEKPPKKEEYGSTAMSLEILEETTVSKGYASIDSILLDERSIVEFLSYGYEVDKEFYTVKELDTVDGIARMAKMSPQQLLTINPQLKSREQLLKEGEELNVTFFDSPINVIVEKETTNQEVVYPQGPKYIMDPTLREGVIKTTVEEESGLEKVTYKETYVNGQLKDGAEVLEKEMLKAPVREVIKRGTMILPKVGSGKFRYPVDNVRMTCGWYCYPGHQAADFINSYNRYGSVRASDRGVVTKAGYDRVGGYYVRINHNNGYETYYGHMNQRPFVSVGQTVTRGEVIGQIGQTGVATGPHVHMEIKYNGVKINPLTVVGR